MVKRQSGATLERPPDLDQGGSLDRKLRPDGGGPHEERLDLLIAAQLGTAPDVRRHDNAEQGAILAAKDRQPAAGSKDTVDLPEDRLGVAQPAPGS